MKAMNGEREAGGTSSRLPSLFASFCFFSFPFFLSSCSPRTLTVRAMGGLLDRGTSAFNDEPDVWMASRALPAQLELGRELLRNAPQNPSLLILLAQGFDAEAFLFMEDENPARARSFYERGADYALRALSPPLRALGSAGPSEWPAILKNARRCDVPALFWFAFGKGGAIRLAGGTPEALAELPKTAAVMETVARLDPFFYFGGADAFLGFYYAAKPVVLGGSLALSKAHFQNALDVAGGKFLMTKLMMAQSYAVAAQDRELFKSLLADVAAARPGRLPGAFLADQVAKEKAKSLLGKIDEYF